MIRTLQKVGVYNTVSIQLNRLIKDLFQILTVTPNRYKTNAITTLVFFKHHTSLDLTYYYCIQFKSPNIEYFQQSLDPSSSNLSMSTTMNKQEEGNPKVEAEQERDVIPVADESGSSIRRVKRLLSGLLYVRDRRKRQKQVNEFTKTRTSSSRQQYDDKQKS